MLSLIGLDGLEVVEESSGEAEDNMIVPLAIGLIFLIFGIGMLAEDLTKLTFDLAIGTAYRSLGSSLLSWKEVCCEIEDIQAIQLLMKEFGSDKEDHCYEINVVLKDGLRFNAWVSGVSSCVRRDAMLLAEFLDKPLLESEKCALLND